MSSSFAKLFARPELRDDAGRFATSGERPSKFDPQMIADLVRKHGKVYFKQIGFGVDPSMPFGQTVRGYRLGRLHLEGDRLFWAKPNPDKPFEAEVKGPSL